MELEIRRPVKINVDVVRVVVPVEQEDIDEECCPADMPGLANGTLTLVLDLDTRKVRDWPAGREAAVHLKPVDSGHYYLLSGSEVVVARERAYVPGFMPGDHYGDYLILNIGPDGTVKGWDPDPTDVEECIEADE